MHCRPQLSMWVNLLRALTSLEINIQFHLQSSLKHLKWRCRACFQTAKPCSIQPGVSHLPTYGDCGFLDVTTKIKIHILCDVRCSCASLLADLKRQASVLGPLSYLPASGISIGYESVWEPKWHVVNLLNTWISAWWLDTTFISLHFHAGLHLALPQSC